MGGPVSPTGFIIPPSCTPASAVQGHNWQPQGNSNTLNFIARVHLGTDGMNFRAGHALRVLCSTVAPFASLQEKIQWYASSYWICCPLLHNKQLQT